MTTFFEKNSAKSINCEISSLDLLFKVSSIGLGLGVFDEVLVSVSKIQSGFGLEGYSLDYITCLRASKLSICNLCCIVLMKMCGELNIIVI